MNDLEKELYSNRMLLFIETEPQSNKYHQVLLTKDQLKQISDVISKFVEKGVGEMEIVELQTSTEEYELPDLEELHPDWIV